MQLLKRSKRFPARGWVLEPPWIKRDMLRVPFFQVVSAYGPTGKIQGPGSFSSRTVDLGHRAVHEENIGTHDIRRESIVKADGNF